MHFVIRGRQAVVDYDEFVPLAVDMIQSVLLSQSRQDANQSGGDGDRRGDVQSMSQSEIDFITEMCMKRLKEIVVKGYGVLRPKDVKRCLNSVGSGGEGGRHDIPISAFAGGINVAALFDCSSCTPAS